MNEIDGVANDANLDDPLSKSPVTVPLVTAWLDEEAIAEAVVEGVEKAQTDCDTLNLAE